ncbi:MAG: M48 family metalloprotease [Desulfobacterales bacterium]|nr:M48 family metalloprotease [Desulfobacterales bacterium]
MYGNFIYFILVLLIYTTYYPPENPYLGPFETVGIFLLGVGMLAITTRVAFDALSKKTALRGTSGLHGEFDRLFKRQAILAIVIFAVNIYVLNLKFFLMTIPPFTGSPTLMALLFVGLFIGYLAIIWAGAYQSYKVLFQTQLSRRSYVLSNISFSLPVILPWLMISAGVDIINILPFSAPKRLLATPEGQVVFFSFFLAALVLIAPSLIKFFWQCRPLPRGPKRRRIEAICEKAKLKYNNILKWPIFEGKLLTAGVMGLIKRFRYILVTESLLQILNDDEIDAVMAHEIGHIKKKHLVFYLIFFLGFIVLSYAAFDLIVYAILYSNLSFPIVRDIGFEQVTLTSLLLTVAMAGILLIYFRYVFGYFMRNCERQADLYAFHLLGSSRWLVSSLEKIAVYSGRSHDRPSWHHFSIRQRIDFLNKCEANRRMIVQHDRKLRRSIMLFIGGLLCTGYIGYAINFGQMGQTLSKHFLQKVLIREIKQNPTNPGLYSMLGSIYYQNKEYVQAVEAYEKSIELAPRDPEALNNLAWLYATCEQTKCREPVKALVYARHAAAMKPVPHILDTLAESYYVNGLHEKAIMTIKQALAMQLEDRTYYENQLRKFKQGAVHQGIIGREP